MPRKYTVLDLFSGCGGLSLGLSMTGRFSTLLAWDNFEEALDTFGRNHPTYGKSPILLRSDIREKTEATLIDSLQSSGFDWKNRIDCVVGGPPCEGFSQNRSLGSGGLKREVAASRVHKFIDDPRNQLFKYFLHVVDIVKPRVVLIENVPAMVRHRNGGTLSEIFSALAGIGYVASAQILNAADYGVPQMRRRAFIMAQRIADRETSGVELAHPIPTHRSFPLAGDDLDDNPSWLPGDSGYWTSVWEAIGDLPPAFADDDFDHAQISYPSAPLSNLRRFLRQPNNLAPFNHIARPLGPGGLVRVRVLKPGQTASELPDDLKPRSFYHYSYGRLKWSDPARTITKFVYNVASGMFAHPVEDRGITMREAARLQTFPDNYRFHAAGIRELSAMIGNAVPPLLATHLGKSIARYLDVLTYLTSHPEERAKFRGQKTDAVLRRLESERWTTETVEKSQLDLTLTEELALEEEPAE